MYRLHQERLKLPCPRGLQAEGRIPVPFQGVEAEWYTLPLEPSLPPSSSLHLCLSFIDSAGFEELTRLHPSTGSHFPAQPRAPSLGQRGRCHFRNQKRSSISIDFFPLVLNWYLLWRSGSSWQHSVARDDVGLAFLKVQSSA